MQKKAEEQPFQLPPPRRRGLGGWTGFGKKTLWDWLQLLIVPVVIGVGVTVGAAWFTEQRTQEEALQSYLDQMGQLMTDEGLRESESGDAVRSLARARTLTVLDRLDGPRKASVLRFLAESELITKGEEEESSPIVVNLHGANLRGVDARGSLAVAVTTPDLTGADLSEADLSGADLSWVTLTDTYLRNTILRDADLSGTNMIRADLTAADLTGANLYDADLTDANLKVARLEDTNVSKAKAVTQDQLDQAGKGK